MVMLATILYVNIFICVQRAMPVVEQQADLHIQAEAYLTCAKCSLIQSQSQSGHRRYIRRAIRFLKRSLSAFERLQCVERCREMWYLLARAHHEVNNTLQRDRAAAQFSELSLWQRQSQNQKSLAVLPLLAQSSGILEGSLEVCGTA